MSTVLFPEIVFMGLVYGAILLTVVGGVSLLVLLVRDWKGKSIW